MSERAPSSSLLRVFFGVADLLGAAVTLFGIFVALPARWAPIDLGGSLASVLLLAAGLGLLADTRWAPRVTRIAAGIVLFFGLATIVALATTIGFLSGIYGPVGRGGVILFAIVVALVLPYLVVLPGAQLVWLGLRAPRDAKLESKLEAR